MGTAKKTVKYPVNFGNVPDIVRFSAATLGTVAIRIPENSVSTPVTFTSAMLYFSWQDGAASTATSITGFTGYCQFQGSAETSVVITGGTLTNTGEHQGAIFGPLDILSYFNANYGTVTTKNITVRARIDMSNTQPSRAVYAYFELTYEYDDTTGTRVQTICLPWESGTGTLTTTSGQTYCTLKRLTSSLGILSGYTGINVVERWIEIRGNSNSNGSNTNIRLSYNFDSAPGELLPSRTEGLNNGGDVWCYYVVDATALSTTATHTFGLWSSVATRFANISVLEWITFEFTTAGTTRVLNYVEFGLDIVSPLPGTTESVDDLFERQILINEPGPINMVKSGVEVFYNTNASATAQMRAGSQASFRGYAQSSDIVCGMFEFVHGTDADSAQGAAFTLTRGENTIQLFSYRSAGVPYNLSGIFRILYESAVSSFGVAHHTQVNYAFLRGFSFATTTDDLAFDSVQIPQTNYWLTTAGILYNIYLSSASSFLTSQARVLPGEGAGDGWRTLYSDGWISDAELGFSNWAVRARPDFRRYPNDPDVNRLNIESNRNIRSTSSTAFRYGARWMVAYTAIYFTISGTISGSGGGTIQIDLYELNSEGEGTIFDVTTRTGNGSYSFTVYNDTVNYYVVAYESATLNGVSPQLTPGTGFDINLSNGSGGSQTYGWAGG